MKKDIYVREIFKKYQESKGLISANNLLERKADSSYIKEWTELLAVETAPKELAEASLVIFRIDGEWLAMSTYVCKQIADKRLVHTVPHRGSKYLLGVVNLQGQLALCVALHRLLEIDCPELEENTVLDKSEKRFIAIQKEDETWVFPVSEIFGVVHFDLAKVENVPVTVTKSTANYLKGIVPWNHHHVGMLDEELLFYSLRRCF